jgi:hypothetical protein
MSALSNTVNDRLFVFQIFLAGAGLHPHPECGISGTPGRKERGGGSVVHGLSKDRQVVVIKRLRWACKIRVWRLLS